MKQKIVIMNNYFVYKENEIKSVGLSIVSRDFERPWVGFLVIDKN